MFGGITARAFLDKATMTPGATVLVNGASGAVGSAAVQLAQLAGARVTAVTSGGNAELVRSLGADHVIDYTKEDFTRLGQRYDYILDIPGNHSLKECLRALEPDGTYVLIGHDGYGTTTNRWVGGVPRMLSSSSRSISVSSSCSSLR